MQRLILVTALIALSASGCRAAVGAAGSALPESPPAATMSPAATEELAVTTIRPRTPAPAPSFNVLERSDEFWAALLGRSGDSPFVYESLDAAVREAHLVAVGRVTDVSLGEVVTVGDPEIESWDINFAYVVVSIDEVIAGFPRTRVPGSVKLRLDLPGPTPLDDLRSIIPQHDHLFFLLNGGQMSEAYGHSAEEQEAWRYVYIPAGRGGVLRDIDGTTRGINLEDDGLFPSGLEGAPFEEVVQRVTDSAAQR